MSEQGWHFLRGPLPGTLRGGRPAPPDGEWLTHDGPVEICGSGLHFSTRVIDALFHAPGEILCRVTANGVVDRQPDKGVCRRRRIDWRVDATEILRTHARLSALRVAHLLPEETDPVVAEWLKTGREDLRAAAGDAAWDAARAAAGDAAGNAAWAAAGAAARAAARAVAGDAARDAARAAAGAAAGNAAWAAAWAAARAAQEADLLRLIEERRAGDA